MGKRTMSKQPWHGLGLALLLAMGGAVAEDLPQPSILQRFGVTPDQLPAATPGKVTEPEQDKRFQLDGERPVVNVTLGEGKQPETTGNISIDNAAAREFERCRQVRSELQRRGEQRYISCDNSVPGQHSAPWSP